MKRHFILTIMCVLAVLFFSQCNIFESDSTSSSILVIEDLTNTDGEVPLFSSVSESINDLCLATLRARLINPLETESTYYQSIIVEQVDVEYSRVDGLNVEGKDVPYRFSQKVNFLITIDGTGELPFTIVRHVAKLESPLVDLVGGGNEKYLKLEAKITFHGHDVGGHRVQPVTGTVSVWCADFGDISD